MSTPKNKNVSSLKSHIGYWMRLVSNNVSYSFARKVEGKGVTVAEWVILREMFTTGETSPSDIAHLTHLTRGAVSKLVERLLDKGLVSRKEAKADRRYQHITLTAKARQLIPELAKLADDNEEEFFVSLSKAERKTLSDLLQKIAIGNNLTAAPID